MPSETLYSYVSRGFFPALPNPDDSRRSPYDDGPKRCSEQSPPPPG